MQTFYRPIGNSLLGDELAIAQQLISDILTCFAADVLDRAPLAAEAPHRGALLYCYIDTSYSKDREPLPPLAEVVFVTVFHSALLISYLYLLSEPHGFYCSEVTNNLI